MEHGWCRAELGGRPWLYALCAWQRQGRASESEVEDERGVEGPSRPPLRAQECGPCGWGGGALCPYMVTTSRHASLVEASRRARGRRRRGQGGTLIWAC
jgi:hypothetical protein